MRRKDCERDDTFAMDVIDHCEYGVMALNAGAGAPYCLPLSMVRVADVLYFHCALEGRKLELLHANPEVSVTFVSENIGAQDDFTTYFKSAIVEGTAFELIEDAAKIEALRILSQRLTPKNMNQFDRVIASSLHRTGVWGIRMNAVMAKEKRPKTQR